MPDKICAGPVHGSPPIKEAVCINTKKVYDSCRYRDCLQDIRIYLCRSGQEVVDRAQSVRPRSAELLWTYIDVEPLAMQKGFYTVDVKYYYRVTIDVSFGAGRPCEVKGLASFSKRIVLYGSEGSVRIFSSKYIPDGNDLQTIEKTNMPNAVVEVVDPILLSAKIVTESHKCGCECCILSEVPEAICRCFSEDIVLCEDSKKILVTIGQFAIVRLERDIQLLIPSYDICMPAKECLSTDEEEPCVMFQKFNFPVDQFFPPEAGRSYETREPIIEPCKTCCPPQRR